MASLKEIDKIDCRQEFNTNFSCEWSYCDILSVLHGNKVYILQLGSDPCNLNNKLCFTHDYIEANRENHPSTKGLSDFKDLTSILEAPDFLSLGGMKNAISVTQIKWSPKGLLMNDTPLLALVTNVGRAFIAYKQSLEWSLSGDIRTKKECNGLITAVEWIYFDDFYYLATAQSNGDVILWRVCLDMNIKGDTFSMEFSSLFKSEFQRVHSMRWIPISVEKGTIILGGLLGEADLFILRYSNGGVVMADQTTNIYSDKDKLAVARIEYSIIDDKTVAVVLVKSIYVIVIAVQIARMDVTYMEVKNMHSEVTGCTWYSSSQLAVSTNNDGIHIISINFQAPFNDILKSEPVNMVPTNQSITGVALSSNKAIWAYTTLPTIKSFKKTRNPNVIHFSWMEDFASLKNALLTEHFTISRNKDFLEILRLYILQKKISLKMWVNKLRLDKATCSKLYLYVLKMNAEIKLCNKLDLRWENDFEDLFTDKLMEDKEEISSCVKSLLFESAVSRIVQYCDLLKMASLGEFESNALRHCVSYVKIYKGELGAIFKAETLKIIEGVEEIPPQPCDWCGKDILGITCTDAHPTQRCCLTFQAVESSDYLECTCRLIARIELLPEKPQCPMCNESFKRTLL